MLGPVILADLAQEGTLLHVWCRCGHRAELKADAIPLPKSTPMPGIARPFRRAVCGTMTTPVDHSISYFTACDIL